MRPAVNTLFSSLEDSDKISARRPRRARLLKGIIPVPGTKQEGSILAEYTNLYLALVIKP